MVVERLIQKIKPGKWADLEELDRKYDEVEGRLGFPSKKRFRCIAGGHDDTTLIIERQWDSLAVMEATYHKASADPELQALWLEGASVVGGSRVELYMPLP
jgi:hypothetical protein